MIQRTVRAFEGKRKWKVREKCEGAKRPGKGERGEEGLPG
jgi:hypothetical protein